MGVKQYIIIRMKSHSSRYAIYNKRKANKNKNIKILPCITDRRKSLLAKANLNYDRHPAINFIYIDINGDLKVRLNESINNKYAFRFEEVDERSMISKTFFIIIYIPFLYILKWPRFYFYFF